MSKLKYISDIQIMKFLVQIFQLTLLQLTFIYQMMTRILVQPSSTYFTALLLTMTILLFHKQICYNVMSTFY